NLREWPGYARALHVSYRPTPEAASMEVLVGPSVVSCRPITIGELGRQVTAYQRLEGFIDSGKRNVGDPATHGGEHLVRGGMLLGARQDAINGGTLLRESLP